MAEIENIAGVIFDIEEFAVFDGPGMRCAIFLKGCPLNCKWCHNPEGISMYPQRLKYTAMCKECGMCRKVCGHPDKCVACGKCADACPGRCIRIAGERITAGEFAQKVRKFEYILKKSGGGVTFTGGEALMQPDFVCAVKALIPDIHTLIETSGFADTRVFARVVNCMDMVIMDIKMIDAQMHKKWTGVENSLILENLKFLKSSGKPFRIRVPLIPGVNDSLENMEQTAALLSGAEGLEKVELLHYNKAAGSKYKATGIEYKPGFDETLEPNIYLEPFRNRGITVSVL